MATSIVERWSLARYNAYRWRYEQSLVKKVALALAMAGLTGLAAQVRIPLPWTVVPITGQTFAVLLAGVLLGRNWGGVSLALYVIIGALGVPWFAPKVGMPIFSAGGIGHLAGPTGGYLLGFILAAFFLGYFTDKYIRARSFVSMLALMLFANFVLIYIPGLLQLHLWLNLVMGKVVGFHQLLVMGLLPFIPGDIFKAVAAAMVAKGITPKQAYNGEVDKDK